MTWLVIKSLWLTSNHRVQNTCNEILAPATGVRYIAPYQEDAPLVLDVRFKEQPGVRCLSPYSNDYSRVGLR